MGWKFSTTGLKKGIGSEERSCDGRSSILGWTILLKSLHSDFWVGSLSFATLHIYLSRFQCLISTHLETNVGLRCCFVPLNAQMLPEYVLQGFLRV